MLCGQNRRGKAGCSGFLTCLCSLNQPLWVFPLCPYSSTPFEWLHTTLPPHRVWALGGLLSHTAICPGVYAVKGAVLTLGWWSIQIQEVLPVNPGHLCLWAPIFGSLQHGQKLLNGCSAGHHRSIMSCLTTPYVLPSAATTWLPSGNAWGNSTGQGMLQIKPEVGWTKLYNLNKEVASVLEMPLDGLLLGAWNLVL